MSNINKPILLTMTIIATFLTATNSFAAQNSNSSSTIETQSVRLDISRKLNDRFPDNNIEVTVFNNDVLLTGQIKSQRLKKDAEKYTIKLTNDPTIMNYLEVRKPQSAAQTAQDLAITSTVKGTLLSSSGIDSGKVKVVTSNGKVYLLGTIDKSQERKIIDNVRTVAGVKKVIYAFKYNEQ